MTSVKHPAYASSTQDLTQAHADCGLHPIANRAAHYMAIARSQNTRRAYRSDWVDFTAWCASHALASLPATPETVALYLADAARAIKASTLTRRLAALAKAHQAAGFESPCSMRHAAVSETLAGIRREKGTMPEGKSPLMTSELVRLSCGLPDNKLGIRDRALLLIGFAGGFRRSELADLTIENIAVVEDGLRVLLRRSKTDPDGAGRTVGIPFGSNPKTCPVRAYRRWLEVSAITAGPVFRGVDRHGHIAADAITPQVVALVVKRSCKVAGLDASRFGAHSLRSGLATQAARNGASERAIMNQTGHRSVQMVRRYIREGELFNDNAAAKLGL
jgi:site-specific recombinase XerD